MSNWSITCVVKGTPITHFVLADTPEEAIRKVLGDNPDDMGEVQQVKALNLGD